MLRNTIISMTLLFLPFHSEALKLPVNNDGGVINSCNNYTNKAAAELIKKHNVKFNPVHENVINGEIIKVKDWDEITFYTNLSTACSLGANYASHKQSEDDSIKWTLQTKIYSDMYDSSYGKIPGESILNAIKEAVIFGRSLH